MSGNSKKSKKRKVTWGIEESYFPFKLHVAPLDRKDLEQSRHLTPEQRIEWLLMIQNHLIRQFGKQKK